MHTEKNNLTQKILDQIKDDMIFGYYDDDGTKQYPTLKAASEWFKVDYDSLRQKARKWNWQKKRKEHKKKVSKTVEKKKSEAICESEAEAIVVNDVKFNEAAELLREVSVKELQDIKDGKQVIRVLDDGTKVLGVQKAGYQLMNLGKALESAQKVSKIAAGEPSDIQKLEGAGDTYNQFLLEDHRYIQSKAAAMDGYYKQLKEEQSQQK